MRRTRKTLTALSVAIAIAFSMTATAQFGCVLNDDFLRDSDVFQCEDNGDCGEPGYTCNPSTNRCERAWADSFCEDQDNDGYGVGEVRDECAFTAEDPDDTDASINPGAHDICDGKDNDVDGEVDELLDCSEGGDRDCYTQLQIPRENTLFSCIEDRCVLLPANSTGECEGVRLRCEGGVYDDSEAVARGCIPPE